MTEVNYKTIQLAYDSGVATITLNRPDKRNAISFELIDDLLRALEEVETSDAIVLIVTGAGKAFCSGMDLDNLKALIGRSPEQNLKDSETMVRLFRSLYEFPKVTIAAVNGAAIAGGTGLALLCDFTLAVPKPSLATPKCASALCPPSFRHFLLRQVGEKQARDLLLTGRIIGADEAARMGLVNEIVPPENLMMRARELAALLMENSPASLRATKQLLTDHARAELDLQIEAAVRRECRDPHHRRLPRRDCVISRKAQTGVEREMKIEASPTGSSTKPGCACVTRRPIRWAWSTIPTISSGLKWDASNCCGSWAFPIATWRRTGWTLHRRGRSQMPLSCAGALRRRGSGAYAIIERARVGGPLRL